MTRDDSEMRRPVRDRFGRWRIPSDAGSPGASGERRKGGGN